MPEHLKALVVILVLAAGVFAFAKGSACALGTSPRDFALRRNTWFAVTLTVFLAHHFWIFMAAAASVLLFAASRERNRIALVFALLFAVPAISMEIPGFAGVRSLFSLDWIRLLALTVLLPAFIALVTSREGEPFGRRWPDRLIVLYLVLNFALVFTSSSATHALRHGVFYGFVDVFLPYYVASRSLKSLEAFREALTAFVVAALVLAAIGLFESAKQWLLYRSLEDALRANWGFGVYLEREGYLRALGSTGQPIAFGYVMAVAIGFMLHLRRLLSPSLAGTAALAVLGAGLVTSVSRGPWLGAMVVFLLALAPGKPFGMRLLLAALMATVIAPFLFLTSAGRAIVEFLPFVGSVDPETIFYRQQLLEAFFEVIARNPWFGAYDYMLSPTVQQLRQGDGIIDVVNTYVGIGFTSGLVGLGLFVAFFAAVAAGLLQAARRLGDRRGETYALGQTLFATLLGVLVIISTASSITVIPAVYWVLAGMGVGYARLAQAARSSGATAPAMGAPAPALRTAH